MGSYSPPVITAAGLSIPTYQAILAYYMTQFRSIYGQTVYLGNDSADFQFLSILALAYSDTVQALQLEYNNRAPNFAIGAALDSLVKINGIARKPASFSNCVVLLTGTPGTTITNGIVSDVNGNQWSLPPSVTIGGGGTVTATAVCTVPGAVGATPGQISSIATPTAGWTSVTNLVGASVGLPVETDSQLRTRQSLSTELPSITLLAGTVAAIAAVAGVSRYNVVENPTGSVDGFGNPPHSITAVVEGGTDSDVATAIYDNRGIGCLTNGTTTIVVTDATTGVTTPISFDRPTLIPIFVSLGVHALPGYTTGTTAAIQNAVNNYLNSLQIGELLTISGLYAAALAVTPNISTPLFSIRSLTAGLAPSPVGTTDIPVNFNQVTQGILTNVIVTLV